jgi:ADP-ribose pyrophosphatase YjhB (NUDIX family)
MSPKKRRIDYWQDPKAPKPTNRKASASVMVRDKAGRLLLLQRPDNDLWTIPTGAVNRGETVAEAAVRECREETGLQVEITGLVGVFSTPTTSSPTSRATRSNRSASLSTSACTPGRSVAS